MTAFLALICNGQQTNKDDFLLSVSPIIDKTSKVNNLIINALTDFLNTKNYSLIENKNWVRSDFEKYVYPYLDIYTIENSKFGKGFYKPTLVEIIPTEKTNQKIIKIAFIGHNSETQELQLKTIYNVIANINQDTILFSRYLDHATEKWHIVNKNSLTYKISPNKTTNKTQIAQQQIDIKHICKFLKCDAIPITYYSCINPKELFEIKGFDYTPMMYIDKTGGLADYGNIIFSGNNAEIYTHEIVHIYTSKLFPKIDKFIDEGLATYMAGSGKFDYKWHRNKLDKFLTENPNYNLAEHTDAYERIYFESETSIPYLTSALILERTLRIYGKDKLLDLLKSEKDLWTSLEIVGVTKENINTELRKEVKLPLTPVW
ncbi:MAG: hypothetical protein M0D57_13530 [Sphingobacteriales bacterium JAD_PAG50586_3]|nr:MAG: hypothetical protein M0D57_13530 [Sphingobacteriales bacterium JAD_PAG50586_3]